MIEIVSDFLACFLAIFCYAWLAERQRLKRATKASMAIRDAIRKAKKE